MVFRANGGRKGEKGDKGDKGDSAEPLELPRIVAINWIHGREYIPSGPDWANLIRHGLIVAFEPSKPVLAETLPRSIELLVRRTETYDAAPDGIVHCWCSIPGIVEGIELEKPECGRLPVPKDDKGVPAGPVTGARFLPISRNGQPAKKPLQPGEYMVVIHGDQVLGANEIEVDGVKVHPALDANHLAPYLTGIPAAPPLGTRCPTGNRTEGGTFRSWFRGGGDVNTLDEKALADMIGDKKIAKAIVEHRHKHGAFNSFDDLAQVKGVGPAALTTLRENVTLG